MQIRLLKLIVVAGFAAITLDSALVKADGKPVEPAVNEFIAFMTEFRKQKKTPALTAVVLRDGKILMSLALGCFDDEGDYPTTPQTVFGIASVTKPITAAAMLRDAEEGTLSLDTPLSAHPGFDDLCKWLRGSGIPFGGGVSKSSYEGDSGEIAPVACERKLTIRDALNMRVNGDGRAYVYNPIIYARIDRALEASGLLSFRDLVRKQSIVRSGMEHTALGRRDPKSGQALQRLAEPFASKDGKLEKAPLPDDDFRAAAGIYTSAEQLARFDRAVDQGLLPKRYANDIFKKPVGPKGDYRWGWYVQNWQDTRLVWHGGWEPEKYSALYLKVPERRLTLIVLTNTEALWWGNPLDHAKVQNSPVAAKFLELFAS